MKACRILAAGLVCVAGSALAATPSPAQVDALMAGQLKQNHIPGAAIAVVRAGQPVLVKSYGLANVELGVPTSATSEFELLSLAKQFVAAGVLLLHEDGRLQLDDPVRQFLPDLPQAWGAVTVRQLLSHTSGIPDYVDAPTWRAQVRSDVTDAQLLKTVYGAPLQFRPGSQWRYSNSNYLLLGRLIEAVAKKPYDAFLTERIFKPLGMSRTRIDLLTDIIPGRASGYTLTRQGLKNAEFISPTQKGAAGQILSSAQDMAKWAAAKQRHLLLSQKSWALMSTAAQTSGGTTADYGLGTELSLDHGHRTTGHQGGGLAFNATLLEYPDDGLSVVALTNLTQGQSRDIARSIAALYLPQLNAKEAAVADPSPAITARLAQLLQAIAAGNVDPGNFAPAVRDRMVPMVKRIGPAFLGPLGALKSLTLLERRASGDETALRYRATFDKGEVVWNFRLDGTGAIVSLEPEDNH